MYGTRTLHKTPGCPPVCGRTGGPAEKPDIFFSMGGFTAAEGGILTEVPV